MRRPRRPNDTEEAIDEAVESAADAVERRLDHEGIAKPRVTPRDVLRSRYPRDTVDDEEVITSLMSDEEPFSRHFSDDEPITTPMSIPTPLAPMPIPTPSAIRNARSGSGHSSLSPLAVGPRASRSAPPVGPRPTAHARRAAHTATPKPRAAEKTGA